MSKNIRLLDCETLEKIYNEEYEILRKYLYSKGFTKATVDEIIFIINTEHEAMFKDKLYTNANEEMHNIIETQYAGTKYQNESAFSKILNSKIKNSVCKDLENFSTLLENFYRLASICRLKEMIFDKNDYIALKLDVGYYNNPFSCLFANKNNESEFILLIENEIGELEMINNYIPEKKKLKKIKKLIIWQKIINKIKFISKPYRNFKNKKEEE